MSPRISKPLISGILGPIAVVIGLAGITQSWTDQKEAHVIIDRLTGTDLLAHRRQAIIQA
jgi:hypothetical protein